MIELRINMPNNMLDDIYETDEARANFRQFLHTVMDKLVDALQQPPTAHFPSIRSTVLHSYSLIINKECAVCLEPIRLYSTIQIPPCRHGFHTSCLKDVIQHHHTSCPICRKSFIT